MKIFSVLICAFLLLKIAKSQTTVNITADKDNTIYSPATENSNGSGIYFYAGRQGTNNNSTILRALIHFDLTSIPAGSTVNSATLTLNVDKVAAVPTAIELHKLTANWGEGASVPSNESAGTIAADGDATWNHSFSPGTAWTTPGGDFEATATASTGNVATGVLAIPGLAADVQSWIDNSAINFGWMIKSPDEVSLNSAKKFISRNNSSANMRPVLSVTYTSSLPVNLKNFRGGLHDQKAILQWETATESNNSYYEIEHSSDGINFSPVGKVSGNGNSSLEHSYTFTHADLKAGANYYRLCQHDFDGKVMYSNIIVIVLTENIGLHLHPNPITNILNLTTLEIPYGSVFTIYTIGGHEIKRGTVKSSQINVEDLSNGTYLLTVKTPGNIVFRSRFIKQ
jgi:hypothetical protein